MKFTQFDENSLGRTADNIRSLSIAMVEKAKSGHPGGAMGGADFLSVLFAEYLRYDPCHPDRPARDRFFLDPGHMSPMLYSQLMLSGFFTVEELKEFRQWGSATPGHPERNLQRGIENTSGPLGQGHVFAVGAAIAAKISQQRFGEEIMPQRIYAFISDGGIQEEISQGAGRIAGHLGLDNLVMFYDANDVQLSTKVQEVTHEDVKGKYEAWGWHVITINGNNIDAIRSALDEALVTKNMPTLIIGRTRMAYKALDDDGNKITNRVATHGQPLSKAGVSLEKTFENLGFSYDDPFFVSEEAKAVFSKRDEELSCYWQEFDQNFKVWEEEHPEDASEYHRWFDDELPRIDWASIEQKPSQATRAASSTVLARLAKEIPNMVVASADLCNSDKTDGFLKGGAKPLSRDDFSGRFLQAGVSELTMSALCVGMMLHGGIIAACGTFFVFSDYQKPVVRLAALMEIPMKFIWSHDAFRVGEDGPTHEPVEQEAQIRLMEKLLNHSGRPSLLVLRPADVYETTVAWQMAIENTHTPTALILSRQDIQDLPNGGKTPYERALQAKRGAYVVSDDERTPEIVLLANGSEVSTLEASAAILRREGHAIRVVSVPSEELFLSQSAEYRESVLPVGVKRFGLTAGLPVNLIRLVSDETMIHGFSSFGFSAPYKVLDEKLGFTPEAVAEKVRACLK